MEVHHHPNVEKKNFKEYLLEGLMIFLAVTMGFIAENIRENITERERAKVFAAAMVKDLKADTAEIINYKKYFTNAINQVDTLMQLLSVSEPKNIPSGKLYWYGLFGGAHRYFIPNDATFQQMKSSGTLRYFQKSVAGDVAEYDKLCRLMLANDENEIGIYTEVRKSRSEIFDFKYNDIANNIIQDFYKNGSKQKVLDSFFVSNPPLLSYNKVLFNKYVELVRSRFMNSKITNADALLNQAKLLLSELNKEYHLEK